MLIFIFAVGVLVLSLGLCSLISKNIQASVEDKLILIAIFDIIFLAVTSNVLAVIGAFSIYNIVIFISVVAAVLIILNRKKSDEIICTAPVFCKKKLIVLVLGCILLFLFYYAFPISSIMQADSFLHYYKAVHTAQTGGIDWSIDTFITQNYHQYKEIVSLTAELSSAMEYGVSNIPGKGIEYNLHLYSSFLAIGYLFRGVSGLYFMNAVIALGGVGAIYLAAKEIFGNKVAFITILMCIICPAQMYCARTTLTELLNQLIFWTSIFLLTRGMRLKQIKICVVAGILLGLTTFCRIDSYIWGVGVYLMFIYFLLFCEDKEKKRCYTYIVVVYTILLLLGILYTAYFSFPYFVDHVRQKFIPLILGLDIFLLLVGIILGKLINKFSGFDLRCKSFINWLFSKDGAWYITFILGVTLFVLYFVRPEINGSTNAGDIFISGAFVQFCYYTSFLCIPLMILGIYHVLSSENREFVESALFALIFGGTNFIIYIVYPSVAARHYWAGRRWIVVAIPFVFLFAVYALQSIFLTKKRGKILVLVSMVLIFGHLIIEDRAILFRSVNKEAYENYKEYAEKLDDDKIYFTDNSRLANAMRALFEKKNVYLLSDDSVEALPQYLQKYEYLYYIGYNLGLLTVNENIYFERVFKAMIESENVENSVNQIPREVLSLRTTGSVYILYYSESGEKKEYQKYRQPEKSDPVIADISAMASQYIDERGVKDFASKGEVGYLMYGPYVPLEEGEYEVQMEISLQSPAQGTIATMDVCGTQMDVFQVLKEQTIDANDFSTNTQKFTMRVNLDEDMRNMEFRLFTNQGVYLKIEGIKVVQVK